MFNTLFAFPWDIWIGILVVLFVSVFLLLLVLFSKGENLFRLKSFFFSIPGANINIYLALTLVEKLPTPKPCHEG